MSGGATRPAAAYLRGEQGETDRVQSGQVTRGRARAANAAHLDTKPHNTLLIVRVRAHPPRPRSKPDQVSRCYCHTLLHASAVLVGAHQPNDCRGARRDVEEGRSLS